MFFSGEKLLLLSLSMSGNVRKRFIVGKLVINYRVWSFHLISIANYVCIAIWKMFFDWVWLLFVHGMSCSKVLNEEKMLAKLELGRLSLTIFITKLVFLLSSYWIIFNLPNSCKMNKIFTVLKTLILKSKHYFFVWFECVFKSE